MPVRRLQRKKHLRPPQLPIMDENSGDIEISEHSPSEQVLDIIESIAKEMKKLQRFNKKIRRAQIPALGYLEVGGIGLGVGFGSAIGMSAFMEYITDTFKSIELPFKNLTISSALALIGLGIFIGMKYSDYRKTKTRERKVEYEVQKRETLALIHDLLEKLHDLLSNLSKLPSISKKQEKMMVKFLRQIYNSSLEIDNTTKKRDWQLVKDAEAYRDQKEIDNEAKQKLGYEGYKDLAGFFDSYIDYPEEVEMPKPLSLFHVLYLKYIKNPRNAKKYAEEFRVWGEGNDDAVLISPPPTGLKKMLDFCRKAKENVKKTGRKVGKKSGLLKRTNENLPRNFNRFTEAFTREITIIDENTGKSKVIARLKMARAGRVPRDLNKILESVMEIEINRRKKEKTIRRGIKELEQVG